MSGSEHGTASGSKGAAHGARSRRAWPFVTLGLAAGLAVTAACADLLGPDRLVTPQLQEIWIPPYFMDAGIMYVEGYPADTMFRLESGQRVPVEITVSSGDSEATGLYRRLCPPRERGPGYDCFEFELHMRDGYFAQDLADHVAEMGGRFFTFWDGGRYAAVELFSPDDLVGRARRARSLNGVESTDLVWDQGSIDGEPLSHRFRSLLRVPLPVDIGAAVPGDGIVQVRRGDTVAVVYRQPSGGGVLRARETVP